MSKSGSCIRAVLPKRTKCGKLEWVWFSMLTTVPGGVTEQHMAGARNGIGCAFEHTIDSALRGFHVYQDIWRPVVNEQLKTIQEHGNIEDQFSVAVYKEVNPGPGVTFGHLPHEISRLCWYFLEHDGEILCTITNDSKRRSPLEQGGLEIPCQPKFVGKMKHINKPLA